MFFSQDDGLGESRHVFLEGNDLPAAWEGRERFVVSELGFGTGLNVLALLKLVGDETRAERPVPHLVYQSVEWSPRPLEDLEALALAWPELGAAAAAVAPVYAPQPGWNQWNLPGLDLRLYVGDARDLPALGTPWEAADAWFLDGYAPDRAPELWEPPLLAWVARSTVPGGTAATYSAAGVVKRGLRAAGFDVVRAPGWGTKRHMVRARLADSSHFC